MPLGRTLTTAPLLSRTALAYSKYRAVTATVTVSTGLRHQMLATPTIHVGATGMPSRRCKYLRVAPESNERRVKPNKRAGACEGPPPFSIHSESVTGTHRVGDALAGGRTSRPTYMHTRCNPVHTHTPVCISSPGWRPPLGTRTLGSKTGVQRRCPAEKHQGWEDDNAGGNIYDTRGERGRLGGQGFGVVVTALVSCLGPALPACCTMSTYIAPHSLSRSSSTRFEFILANTVVAHATGVVHISCGFS